MSSGCGCTKNNNKNKYFYNDDINIGYSNYKHKINITNKNTYYKLNNDNDNFSNTTKQYINNNSILYDIKENKYVNDDIISGDMVLLYNYSIRKVLCEYSDEITTISPTSLDRCIIAKCNDMNNCLPQTITVGNDCCCKYVKFKKSDGKIRYNCDDLCVYNNKFIGYCDSDCNLEKKFGLYYPCGCCVSNNYCIKYYELYKLSCYGTNYFLSFDKYRCCLVEGIENGDLWMFLPFNGK